MKKITLSISAIILASAITGCVSAPELTPEQQKELNRFDISQIKDFGKQLNTAMNKDALLLYAPVSIEQAKEYYQDALDAELKDEKMSLYLQAKKSLEHAYETKKLVQKYLADVADIDRRMKIQNTKEIFEDRYEDFKDDEKDLVILIDKDQVSEALEDKKEVLSEAKDLYGDAVVYRNIHKARMILDSLKDEDLDELAPKHFEKAETIYEESRLSIKKEPDNKELVENLSRKTNEFALYTQTIAKDVYNFRALSKDEQELYFDKLHRNLAKLNPDEETNSILPFPIYEKIDRLQEIYKSCQPSSL